MKNIILSLLINILFIILFYLEKHIRNINDIDHKELIIEALIVLISSLLVLYVINNTNVRKMQQQIYTGSPNF